MTAMLTWCLAKNLYAPALTPALSPASTIFAVLLCGSQGRYDKPGTLNILQSEPVYYCAGISA